MELVGSPVVRCIYSATLNIFRLRVIRTIPDGDVNLTVVRDLLETELESVTRILDRQQRLPLVKARASVRAGMLALQNGQFQRAKENFERAEHEADTAFAALSGCTNMTETSQLRMYAALHTSNYFLGVFNTEGEKQYLIDRLSEILSNIRASTEFNTVGKNNWLNLAGPSIPDGLPELYAFVKVLDSTIREVRKMAVRPAQESLVVSSTAIPPEQSQTGGNKMEMHTTKLARKSHDGGFKFILLALGLTLVGVLLSLFAGK